MLLVGVVDCRDGITRQPGDAQVGNRLAAGTINRIIHPRMSKLLSVHHLMLRLPWDLSTPYVGNGPISEMLLEMEDSASPTNGNQAASAVLADLGVDPHGARQRISRWVRTTPTMSSGRGAMGLAYSVVVKLECLQHAGSFKVRGGFNSVLSSDIPEAGLIAASGGNHGLAVAHVAKSLGVPAEIYVPTASSPVKVTQIRELGADVHVVGALYDDARMACLERASVSGALDIHPYDAPLTVSGQATVGLELMAQCPDIDTVLVAVGGGGLIAGLASALPDSVRIVGVEPERSACLHAAIEAGRPVDVEIDSVAADSLGAKRLGSIAWAVAGPRVDSVIVSDADIREARLRIWADLGVAVEMGGATAMAALISDRYTPAPDERVAVVLCGSNTDPIDLVDRV